MSQEVGVLNSINPKQQSWLNRVLRDETTGGMLLLCAAAIALFWANSQWHASYEHFVDFRIGPESLGLDLPVHIWAADGLLAIFFFVAGVELKHEFVTGTLSTPRLAVVPIAAALGGMLASATIFLIANRGTDFSQAWGIPISTDIAFALAVLAVVGRGLPMELRSFLLTLAVVNDLAAITVIAIFYSSSFNVVALFIAAILLIIFGFLQRHGFNNPLVLIVLAFGIWYATLQSGVHATVAGVVMGLLMRVKIRNNEKISPGDKAESFLRPFSAGFCVPAFALVSAGVALSGISLGEAIKQPLTIGVLLGLLVGQPLGITLGAFLTARFTKGALNPNLSWWDVFVVGTLASIGFTVALLINEVTFAGKDSLLASGKFAIVFTNGIAILVSSLAVFIRLRFIHRKTQV